MRLLRRAALLGVAAGAASAVAAEMHLLPAQSEITFTSRQMGVPVQGRFRSFESDVDFDPAHPEAARIALRIALASVTIGTADTEAELAKPGWFDTRRFPTATFVATALRPSGPAGSYEVAGKLTLKGTSRDIAVPLTLQQTGAYTTASGSFVLRRSDWRIGDGDWSDTSLVADEVQVRLHLTHAPGPRAP